MLHVEKRLTIKASPQTVWAILADSVTWPTWAKCNDVTIERPGDDDAMGVGMIRRIKTGPVKVREEITAFDEPRRIEYKMLSGLPLKNYVAEMILEPSGDATELTWRSRFDATIPGSGAVVRRFMQFIFDSWGAGLVTHAEKVAADG